MIPTVPVRSESDNGAMESADVDFCLVYLADDTQGIIDDREVGKTEKIHLEQS